MLPSIHLIIAIITGLLVLFSDEQAFLWLRGKDEIMSASRVKFLHRAVTTGLVLLMITGGLIYSQAAPAYLSLGTFEVKMVALLALILNTYAIERFSSIATTRSFASLLPSERRPLFISGAISFAGWVTAIVCGLLIA